MTTTNILPSRKLTEFEDIASFDDWWSQIECYYSKDEDFREFFTNPDFTWGGILEKCLNLDVNLGLIKLGLRKPRQMEF